MGTLFLLRHGESAWNRQNRFTGWIDVPITPEGEQEMVAAAGRLRGEKIEHMFTSALKRTIESARIVLGVLRREDALVTSAWQLNERYYGRLQSLNKDETANEFGAEQVHEWRRSFWTRPPGGESLEDASTRILPFFEAEILPLAAGGQNVLVCAHGNTIRALMVKLDRIPPDEVPKLEIPTGGLYAYEIGPTGEVIGKEVC